MEVNINANIFCLLRLATNEMSVTVTSRRLSFFDKLSGFGKIAEIKLSND